MCFGSAVKFASADNPLLEFSFWPLGVAVVAVYTQTAERFLLKRPAALQELREIVSEPQHFNF